MMQLQAKLIQIGNSRGVRIPLSVIEASGLSKKIVMELTDNGVLLKPARTNPRKNWREEFKHAFKNNHEKQLIPDDIDLDLMLKNKW